MYLIKWFRDQWLKRHPKDSQKNCDCTTRQECPHTSPSNCRFNKSNCILLFELKNKKTKNNTKLILWFVASVSLLLYILIIILLPAWCTEPVLTPLTAVLSGVSLSIFAGSILALVIDIPSRLREYETSFIEALSSNSYLKSLDETRLFNLRKEITEQLHKTKVPNMARGLIDFDQKILDLLRRPYYSYYRHSVVCSITEDKAAYIKKHLIEYNLVNPYGVNRNATDYINLRNLVLLKSDTEDAVTNLCISYQTDDHDKESLGTDRIGLDKTPIPDDDFYTHKIALYDKKENDKSKGIKVEFSDHVKVIISYEISVSASDPCFTKRLQHPAKNFRLDYSCNDPNITLFGQIVGTGLKQSDISTNYSSEKKSVSLETFDWLLPTNGAIVVMLKKN